MNQQLVSYINMLSLAVFTQAVQLAKVESVLADARIALNAKDATIEALKDALLGHYETFSVKTA